MTKTTWGGRRAGACSGGPRPGAGRPRVRFTARRGQTYIMERQTIGASDPFHEPERWTLLSVQTGMFEFQHGDDIIVIRLPDDDESYDR